MEHSGKEIFDVERDVRDPGGTHLRGDAPGYQLDQTARGRPILFWRMPDGQEIIERVEVYQVPGEPMEVHLKCLLCFAAGQTNNGLRITQGHKEVSYDPYGVMKRLPEGWSREDLARNFPHGTGGLLSVSEFQCAWEISTEFRGAFPGMAVCPWRVVIEDNIIRTV